MIKESMYNIVSQVGQEETNMIYVNIYEAKTNLSKLTKLLEEKKEDKIIIMKNNVPCFELRPIEKDTSVKLGLAKGKLKEPDYDLFFDDEIEKIFEECDLF